MVGVLPASSGLEMETGSGVPGRGKANAHTHKVLVRPEPRVGLSFSGVRNKPWDNKQHEWPGGLFLPPSLLPTEKTVRYCWAVPDITLKCVLATPGAHTPVSDSGFGGTM